MPGGKTGSGEAGSAGHGPKVSGDCPVGDAVPLTEKLVGRSSAARGAAVWRSEPSGSRGDAIGSTASRGHEFGYIIPAALRAFRMLI